MDANRRTAIYNAGVLAGWSQKFTDPLPPEHPAHSANFKTHEEYQQWEVGFIEAMNDREHPPRRGGARRGSGVKPADGATGLKRTNITIDQESADTLRAFGDGDLSLGIRRAAAHIKKSSQ